ncbi:VUT family protein [Legionella fairfieldensis]|uniref:VUT family protein n=1 Tax=Legionella fairfieldensis TaxID=45064 RepID=UPI0013EF9811|nr:VUT family protein [Legionella fairfieldensis]
MIMLTCDTLAFKVIHILSYDFAASGLIYSLNFSLSSIITEVYGFNLAGRIIWVQLICHILFILLINLTVILPSPQDASTYYLYFNLYHNIWHVLLGSCVAMPIAYFINDIIVSKLKINLYGRKFIYRFLISSIFGSAILVTISYPINFFNQYPIQHILNIAFNTWIYKIFSAIVLLPLAMFLINVLKRLEKTDYYDYGISYNPLNVFSTKESGENRYESQQRNDKNNSTDRYSSF